MKITLRPDVAEALADHQMKRETESTGRDQGPQPIHVSDLLICLVRAWYKRHRGMGVEDFDAASKFRMADGVVAQGFLEGLPGESEVKVTLVFAGTAAQVVGHVDHVLREYDGDPGTPVEMKSTGARVNMPVSTHYFEQLAAYAIGVGGQPGRLVVKHNPPPLTLVVRDVEWSEGELEDWAEELDHRVRYLMDPSEPPDLRNHYSWACNYCPLKGDVCPGGKGGFDGGWFEEEL